MPPLMSACAAVDARALGIAGDFRDDQRRENADDDDHQHHFRERERAGASLVFRMT